MKLIRAHVVVSGLVQGVFFRANTVKAAKANHVHGWVRNLPDGTVEAVFEGPEDAVQKTVKWCEEGPPSARVDKVDVAIGEYSGDFDSFDIKYGI
ncbi:MAG: acylphosphatase [Deltaproteobacteria bacterium]|nr:acylphosphatase [Deltaproteobacteria bacterium]